MNRIPVKMLRVGLTFTQPVYIEDDNLLVPEGVAIRKKDLERLSAWGIETVETAGEIASWPGGAVRDSGPAGRAAATAQGGNVGQTAAAQSPSPAGSAATAAQGPNPAGSAAATAQGGSAGPAAAQSPNPAGRAATAQGGNAGPAAAQDGGYRGYINLIEQLDGIFDAIKSGAGVENFTESAVELRRFNGIIGTLTRTLREERTQIIGYILGGELTGRESAKCAVNTAILSALIAEELSLSEQEIVRVLIGALLHDAGMLKLPRDLLRKNGGLSDTEVGHIKTHPLYAYKLICNGLLYPEAVGLTALQHHERWDGEGYPQGLAGTAIETGARIVSVADAFEAMISEKPYRNSMIGYQAMRNLLADNRRRFDPDILKIFIKIMGIYPIGSLILLNNGAIAQVVELRQDTPLRPQIRILQDGSGRAFKPNQGPLIDLLSDKSLFIARALDPRTMSRDHG
jgi:hypothetical protein